MEAPSDGEPRPLSSLGAAGWTLLVALVFELSLQINEAFHPGALTDIVTWTACKLVAYGLVLFAMLRVHEPESSVREVLGLRAARVLHVLLGLVVGAGLAPGAGWLNGVVARRYPAGQEEIALVERLFAASTTSKKLALVVAVGLVLPAADELFFRGALFTPLARRARPGAVVLATAACDALTVASARGLASMLLVVLALAVIRMRTGSVVPSMAARVAFYGISVVPLALGYDDLDLPWHLVAGSAGAALLALGIIVAAGAQAAPPAPDASADA